MSDASADTLFGPCDTGGLALAPADDQPFVPRPRSSAGLELNGEVGRVVVAWRSHLRMDVAYDYEAAQVVLSCVLGDDRRVDRALTTLIDLGVVDLTTDDGISAALGTNVRLRRADGVPLLGRTHGTLVRAPGCRRTVAIWWFLAIRDGAGTATSTLQRDPWIT